MIDLLDISVTSRLTARAALDRRSVGENPVKPLKWHDQALHRLHDMVAADENTRDIAAWFRTTPAAIHTATTEHRITRDGFWRACANCGGTYMTDSPYIRRCDPCKAE